VNNKYSKTSQLMYVAFGVALLTVCGWISVPSPVPFTLQILGVFVLSGVLGAKLSLLCILCHILLGLIGLPVFSSFKNGSAAIFSPTGGYVLGFVLATLIVGFSAERFGRKSLPLVLSMAAAAIVCYVCEIMWYLLLYGQGANTVDILKILVLPFLPADICKVAVSAYLVKRIHPLIG